MGNQYAMIIMEKAMMLKVQYLLNIKRKKNEEFNININPYRL